MTLLEKIIHKVEEQVEKKTHSGQSQQNYQQNYGQQQNQNYGPPQNFVCPHPGISLSNHHLSNSVRFANVR